MAPGIKEEVKELEEKLTKVDYAKTDASINDTCVALSEVLIFQGEEDGGGGIFYSLRGGRLNDTRFGN